VKPGSTIVFERSSRQVNSRGLEEFIGAARKAISVRGQVSVLIAGDVTIRRLNSRFRGKNSATDVLSFPVAESNGFAGDIAISLDIASRNSRALGHSVDDELRILILHGLLHLAGYDHENDRGEMERKEISLRHELGLPVGLIERTRGKSSLVVGRSPFAKSSPSAGSGRRRKTNDARRLRT
jgi:probable rRNA maturation factor